MSEKMENKTLQIINPKKGKYFFFSQQKPAVITNFWPTLPTTVPGADKEAGGPKTLTSVGLLVEFPSLLLARHLHLPESA